MDYVQVGRQTPVLLLWLLAGSAMLISAYSLLKSRRWPSVIPAASGVFLVVVHPALMVSIQFWLEAVLLCALINLQLKGQANSRDKLTELWYGLAIVLVGIVSILTGSPAGSFSIQANKLVGRDRLYRKHEVDRAHLTIIALTGPDQRIGEWRIDSNLPGATAPCAARLAASDLYQDRFLHYVTASEAAANVAKWAGVKPLRRTYREYAEMGRRDFAKP